MIASDIPLTHCLVRCSISLTSPCWGCVGDMPCRAHKGGCMRQVAGAEPCMRLPVPRTSDPVRALRHPPSFARHAARSSIPALRCAKALARPRWWPARSGGDGSDTVYPSGGMTVWGGLSWVVAPLCLGAHPLVR